MLVRSEDWARESQRPFTLGPGDIHLDVGSQRNSRILLSDIARGFFSRVNHRRTQAELIASLNDVAAAVSSKLSVDEVLDTIVERAKRITNTDKAVLVLTTDHTEALDVDTMVVRGSRDEHPESWWGEELAAIAHEVFATSGTYLNFSKANDAWLLCSPIKVRSQPIGLIAAINSRKHRFDHEQINFLAVLSAFAATAIENARLAEEGRYVLLASERNRIAREMHDGISQSLFSVALGLEVCRKQVARDPVAVSKRLDELLSMLNVSMAELRRFIYDLRPVKLQELGLSGAIGLWIREVTSGEQINGQLEVRGEERHLPPGVEACLYRVAKESVSNVVKHAEAKGFSVLLDFGECEARLTVTDDGCGFEREEAYSRVDSGESFGLASIRERVLGVGGRLDISSDRGGGTTVHVVVPI
ncbi:MAG: GAF domain-containing sensor histidine kinase [Actinomycetota bacterium]|nr:GAF domain-containing sensor histidine kinase [Actinomycetota bacterium]